jgi:hypothetical protein
MRLTRAGLVLATLICEACGAVAAQSGSSRTRTDQAPASCAVGEWGPSLVLRTAQNQPVMLGSPWAVSTNAGLLLFGRPTVVWASDSVFADTTESSRPLIAVQPTLAGVRVGPLGTASAFSGPDGVKQMQSIRAVRSAGDTVEVVWGTPRDSLSSAATELWHARYDGRRWTHPELILSTREIMWSGAGDLKQTKHGTVVAVGAWGLGADSLNHAGVVVLHQRGGRWAQSWIETGTLPASTVAIHDAGQSLVLAFTGLVFKPFGRTEPKGVWVSRLRLDSVAWTALERVGVIGNAQSSKLLMLEAPSGVIHLLWPVDSADQAVRQGSVMHLRSLDAGATWSSEPTVSLAKSVQELDAVAVDDRLLMIGREPQTHGLLAIDAQRDGTATVGRPFEPQVADFWPLLVRRDHGSLIAVWGELRPHAYPMFPGLPAPLLRFAVRPLRCP